MPASTSDPLPPSRRTEQLLEEAFLDEPRHDAVVHYRMKIEALHLGDELGVALLIDDRLQRGSQHGGTRSRTLAFA